LNRQFSEEEIQMTNKYRKTCSTSLAIKEIQIKATPGFHLIPVRLTIIQKNQKNQKTTNAGQDAGKKKPSYTAGGNVN
jgi:hypothetical protein